MSSEQMTEPCDAGMTDRGSGLQQSSLPEWKECRAQRKGRGYV